MKKLCLLLAVALLAALAPVGVAGAGSTDLYTVVFRSETLPADAAALVGAAGGEVVLAIPEIGVMQVRAGGGFIGRILDARGVLTAGPSIVWSLEEVAAEELAPEAVTGSGDYYERYQWDIKRVTDDGASFALGTGSHDVVVAVVDSGIYPHPALAMNLLGGRNFVPAGGLYGNDATETGDPNDFIDRNRHGTHCAGTIAANGRVYGVGPDLGLRAYRVLSASGSGYTSWIAAGMVQATLDGCDVISMSLGGYDVIGQVWWTDPVTGDTYKLGNDIADMLAYQRAALFAANNGTVVVSSAGNAALNCTNKKEVTDYLNAVYGPYGYYFVGATFKVPAICPGVVCVSATGMNDVLAFYSCYGPGYVDLAAPGGDLQMYPYGLCLNAYGFYNPATGAGVSNGYIWMGGTSMACPKVAAVAALIKWADPSLNAHQITVLLQQTAQDIGPIGVDGYFGYGMVNAYSALNAVQP